MKLLGIHDFPFNRITLYWSGPFTWDKNDNSPKVEPEIMAARGLYRAESTGQNREIVKYIGSASESFSQRLNGQHRIKRELVDGAARKVRLFLATIAPETKIRLTKTHFVEVEYILQHAHWHDLISWHGLSKLPKTSRGEGWHIVNKGRRGHLHRVIVYPAFAIAGQDKD